MWHAVRLLVAVIATLMLLGGLAAAVSGLWLEGLWTALIGGVGLLAVAFERKRYGTSTDERPAHAEGQRPTDEIFVDPTTGQRTRVWIDPRSGERSYRPE